MFPSMNVPETPTGLHGAAYRILFERWMPTYCRTDERLEAIKMDAEAITKWAKGQPPHVRKAYEWAISSILKSIGANLRQLALAQAVEANFASIPRPPAPQGLSPALNLHADWPTPQPAQGNLARQNPYAVGQEVVCVADPDPAWPELVRASVKRGSRHVITAVDGELLTLVIDDGNRAVVDWHGFAPAPAPVEET